MFIVWGDIVQDDGQISRRHGEDEMDAHIRDSLQALFFLVTEQEFHTPIGCQETLRARIDEREFYRGSRAEIPKEEDERGLVEEVHEQDVWSDIYLVVQDVCFLAVIVYSPCLQLGPKGQSGIFLCVCRQGDDLLQEREQEEFLLKHRAVSQIVWLLCIGHRHGGWSRAA